MAETTNFINHQKRNFFAKCWQPLVLILLLVFEAGGSSPALEVQRIS